MKEAKKTNCEGVGGEEEKEPPGMRRAKVTSGNSTRRGHRGGRRHYGPAKWKFRQKDLGATKTGI